MTIKARGRTARVRSREATIAAVLKRLGGVKPGKHRVVSCYLKVEPRDRVRGKYLIKFKNRARALEQALPRLGLDRAAADAVIADVARIQPTRNPPQNALLAEPIVMTSEP